MELGARICVPRTPHCEACPVSRFCDARAAGDAESLPVRAPKRAPKSVHAVAALVLRNGKALAVRRPAKGLLGGLWELPGGEVGARERGGEVLARVLRERTGLDVAAVARAGRFDWAFSHRALRTTVYRCEVVRGRVHLDGWDRHQWIAPARFGELPLGSVSKRALAIALASDG